MVRRRQADPNLCSNKSSSWPCGQDRVQYFANLGRFSCVGYYLASKGEISRPAALGKVSLGSKKLEIRPAADGDDAVFGGMADLIKIESNGSKKIKSSKKAKSDTIQVAPRLAPQVCR